MSNINDFTAAIAYHGGIAKTNRFKVQIDLGNILSEKIRTELKKYNITFDSKQLDFLCVEATSPGKQISTTDYKIWARSQKRPYGLVEDDLKISYILTEDYYVKHVIDAWMSVVLNPEKLVLTYLKEYSATIQLQQLAGDNQTVLKRIDYLDAWPLSISEITYTSETQDIIQKVNIDFAFRKSVPKSIEEKL